MKKVVVMSDNHGNHDCLKRIKELEKEADYYIHCGDSEATMDLLESFYVVRGNNDWYNTKLPREIILEVEGIKIYIFHGERVGYFNTKDKLANLGKINDCQIVLFGHFHIPCHEIVDGIHIINPGSTSLPRGGSNPSYAYLEINNGKIFVDIRDYK